LKNNERDTRKEPLAYVAVREDGTEATLDEWRRECDVERQLKHYRALIKNPALRRSAVPVLDAALMLPAPPQPPQPEQKSSGSLVVRDGGGNAVALLQSKSSALAMVRESHDFQ